MRSVRLQFVTVCEVNATNGWKFEGFLTYVKSALTNFSRMRSIAYNLLPYAQGTLIIFYCMRSARLFFFAVCADYVNNLLPYAQSTGTLIICYRLRSVRLQSIKYLAIFGLPCAYAYNLLPHAQGTLTICYRMRRVRLQFVTVCAVYANEAAHMLILPF
jgi:hypothetical protein